jgi:hypothetical protein
MDNICKKLSEMKEIIDKHEKELSNLKEEYQKLKKNFMDICVDNIKKNIQILCTKELQKTEHSIEEINIIHKILDKFMKVNLDEDDYL